MSKLAITISDISEIPNTKMISFDGDFDGYSKENIDEIQKIIDECTPNSALIFEFSKLNYLNSFAIGQIINWHQIANTKNSDIYIVGTNKNVEDIFSVLGIKNILKIFPDIEALKADLSD